MAIEYMGEQHYHPVECFGGNEGFEATIDRDERKAELCKKVGLNLVYFKYDEDLNDFIVMSKLEVFLNNR